MNAEGTKITGMIAVFDDATLNARLDYEIDLATNKVTYFVACHWKPLVRPKAPSGVYGRCPFRNYADARLLFDGLPAVAEQELKATA